MSMYLHLDTLHRLIAFRFCAEIRSNSTIELHGIVLLQAEPRISPKPERRKAQKEKEIKQRYEAELAALNAEGPESLTFKPQQQVSPPSLPLGSQQGRPVRPSSSPSPILDSDRSSPAASSSSESEVLVQPRQSGRVRKPIQNIESQAPVAKLEKTEKEERHKIRKSKFQKAPQLKGFPGL
ncbi:hypothetical protein MMC22_000242 [Lobaria immixta]|nr:hypothetical protein [Lobaria immixta]